MSIITDFGRKVGGARKDAYREYFEGMARELSADPAELARMSLGSAFPIPNYAALAASGVSLRVLAAVAVLRAGIPPKPAGAAALSAWRDQVARSRSSAHAALSHGGQLPDVIMERLPTEVQQRILLIERFPPEMMGEAARYGFQREEGALRLHRTAPGAGTRRFVKRIALLPGDMAAEAFVRAVSGLIEGAADAPRRKGDLGSRAFDRVKVYGTARGTAPFSVEFAHKGVRLVLAGGFAAAREAFAWRQANADDIRARLERALIPPPERTERDSPRVGPVRREGNVSAELLASEFGLSGIEFGNYVEGARRQSDLNRAWDSLCDLAEMAGVPRRDVGFRGALALAFGSRGNGHAAAHYERDRRVINLTKTSGAGSLAHEWFHAWDNAVTIARDGPDARSPLMATEGRAALPAPIREAMRDLRASWGAYKARMLVFDAMRAKPYWSTEPEMAARAFEAMISDRLAALGRSNDHLVAIHRDAGAYPNEAEGTQIYRALGRVFLGATPAPPVIAEDHDLTRPEF